MFAFTKTVVAIALGATAVAGATMAATSFGGLQMSSPAPVASPWQGFSNGWDNAGWQCFSNGASSVAMLGLRKMSDFGQPASNDWGSMALAGCYNGWAYGYLNTGKTQQADSFERRYVGIELPRLPIIR